MPENIKCPKCNTEMEELYITDEDMTEGQEADYDAGFNHTFVCPKCGNNTLCDVESIYCAEEDGDELEELVKIIEINPSSFEDIIENALKSRCFIEAISLIHNVIEAYLKHKLNTHFNGDENKLKLLENDKNYLKDYNDLCYLLGLITKEKHDNIIKFNKGRNTAIHKLLTKSIKIEELRAIAREGREIQMQLSPLNHSENDIEQILDKFDEITEPDD